MATKSTTSTTTTIQLAPAPSRLTVQSSIESGLYGHVSECATEASESRPSPAVSHSLLDMLKAAKKVFLLQPSSAAAERVFSVLKNSFGEQQIHSLQDYIESSVMLQYNKHSIFINA